MIKGWRTKPEWIAHYSEVERKRLDMKLKRYQAEFDARRISSEIESLIRSSENARNAPCFVIS